MESARDKSKGKPIANNTRLYETKNSLMLDTGGIGGYEIRLHGNVIMRIFLHHIEIYDGGWKTRTTKDRLNQFLPSGYTVYQKDWEWYLQHSDGRTLTTLLCSTVDYDFDDVCWIHNDGRVMLSSTHPYYPESHIEYYEEAIA